MLNPVDQNRKTWCIRQEVTMVLTIISTFFAGTMIIALFIVLIRK